MQSSLLCILGVHQLLLNTFSLAFWVMLLLQKTLQCLGTLPDSLPPTQPSQPSALHGEDIAGEREVLFTMVGGKKHL